MASKASRSVWFNDKADVPIIAEKARHMESFLAAVADGVVDDAEIKAQEKRVVALMKEIEPKLDEKLHAKVTELLCELTAYDLMQVLHSMQASRPKTVFRG